MKNLLSTFPELSFFTARRFRASAPSLAHPVRDWFIVLGLSVLGVAGAVLLGVLSYTNLSAMEESTGPRRVESTLDVARLEQALASFRLRAEEHALWLSESPTVSDPSR